MPNQHTKRQQTRVSAAPGHARSPAPVNEPVKATPDVAHQLGRMNGSLVALQDATDALLSRLTPAMSDEANKGEGGLAEIAPETAIGREIAGQRDMVDVITARLNDALSRLGI